MDIDSVQERMLILQSKNSYSRLLELNPINGIYREIRRVTIDGEFSKIKINGVFDFLNGVLLALYAVSGCLILRIENQVISIDEDLDIFVYGNSGNRILTINKYNHEIASLRYSISDTLVFNNDITPFVEDEDFDFGLFVANVISNSDRRNVVLDTW